MNQEIAWFDSINTSELSQRLSNECLAIQRAVGEKLGTIILSFAMSFSGLFFSFFKGWFYSAILLCYFPIMLFGAIFIGVAFSRGFSENMRAYG